MDFIIIILFYFSSWQHPSKAKPYKVIIFKD